MEAFCVLLTSLISEVSKVKKQEALDLSQSQIDEKKVSLTALDLEHMQVRGW